MKINILNILREKLPESIKKPLRRFHNMWYFYIDKNMVKCLAEYSRLDEKEVIWLIKNAERLDIDLWHILNPKTEEDVKNFYKNSPFNIFGLVFWHMTTYQTEFRSEIIKFAKGNVLDFGGGIGDVCAELYKKGFTCDYADLPGITFNFAQWMFKKNNYKIDMIDLSNQKIVKNYDTIYCIDVIEHIPNFKSTLSLLAERLNKNGRLIITNLKVDTSTNKPMHFSMDAKKYLSDLGLSEKSKPWLWEKS